METQQSKFHLYNYIQKTSRLIFSQATYCLHAITFLLSLGPLKTAPNHKTKMSFASLMKNKSQSNNKNKTTITLS
jgi:hypothetical protein